MNWRQTLYTGLLPYCLALLTPIWAHAALKADEHVMILPALAHDVTGNPNLVSVTLSVWVYEQERRPGSTQLLARYMGVDINTLSPEDKARLYARSQLFRVDSERGKQITLRLPGGQQHTLPPTNSSGRSHLTVTLPKAQVIGKQRPLPITLVDDHPAEQSMTGALWYQPAQGLSVISDIDDTIKVSDIGDTQKVLQHTFLLPLQPAPGMAQWYRRLAQDRAATFHYVSSSPVQLLPLLNGLIDEGRFPAGSVHLRDATSWRDVVPAKGASRQHKTIQIMSLLQAYPQRRFILVGDSGELDPEIYADIAKAYPKQIEKIYIRDVTGQTRTDTRYQTLFNGITPSLWVIFAPTGAPEGVLE